MKYSLAFKNILVFYQKKGVDSWYPREQIDSCWSKWSLGKYLWYKFSILLVTHPCKSGLNAVKILLGFKVSKCNRVITYKLHCILFKTLLFNLFLKCTLPSHLELIFYLHKIYSVRKCNTIKLSVMINFANTIKLCFLFLILYYY